MWHDYPFTQRNMKTEKTVGAAVGSDREVGLVGVWTKFEKGVWVGNIGGGGGVLHKIIRLVPSANYVKRL